MGSMTSTVSESAETYRRAEQRLRLLLFGDGTETPGRVRGEESRQQVSAELRRMRNAFHVLVECEEGQAESVERRPAGLYEDLRGIASLRSGARREATPELVTPAEAAHALEMSVGSIYKAIRDGDILAVRLTDKRGTLRIPASELERLVEAARRR